MEKSHLNFPSRPKRRGRAPSGGVSRGEPPGYPLGIESGPNPGEGAIMATSVSTLTELFLKAASYNKPACLLSKVGGTYQPISTAELVDRVRRLSKALRDLG